VGACIRGQRTVYRIHPSRYPVGVLLTPKPSDLSSKYVTTGIRHVSKISYVERQLYSRAEPGKFRKPNRARIDG